MIWFLLVILLPPVGVVLFCVGAVKQLITAPHLQGIRKGTRSDIVRVRRDERAVGHADER